MVSHGSGVEESVGSEPVVAGSDGDAGDAGSPATTGDVGASDGVEGTCSPPREDCAGAVPGAVADDELVTLDAALVPVALPRVEAIDDAADTMPGTSIVFSVESIVRAVAVGVPAGAVASAFCAPGAVATNFWVSRTGENVAINCCARLPMLASDPLSPSDDGAGLPCNAVTSELSCDAVDCAPAKSAPE